VKSKCKNACGAASHCAHIGNYIYMYAEFYRQKYVRSNEELE
jgi:hypothetical protein